MKLKGYKVTRNSTVTIEANGATKTFKHGDHVTFGELGGKQTLTFNGAEFVGYGQRTSRAATSRTSSSCVVPNLTPAAPGGGGGRRTGRGGRGTVDRRREHATARRRSCSSRRHPRHRPRLKRR